MHKKRINKRRYYSHNRLTTWLVSRCGSCGKFIGKLQRKYCLECKIKIKIIRTKNWKDNNKNQTNLTQGIRRHEQGLNIHYRGSYK